MSKKPILILMLGIPGSGKTYLSSALSKSIGAIHLRSDELRSKLFNDYSEARKHNDFIFKSLDYAMEKAITSGSSVIYDSTNTNYEQRHEKYQLAKKHSVNSLLVYLKIEKELALERIKKRDHEYDWQESPENVINIISERIELPKQKEKHITISGVAPVEENIKRIKRKIERLS